MELTLQEQIDRLCAVNEVRNLMGRYAYLHNAHMHEKTANLFALDRDDVWVECGGVGVFSGPIGIRNFFVRWHNALEGDYKGAFNEHLLTTEVIEVAKDGQTAKAVWMSPGAETRRYKPDNALESVWIWGKYAVDFIKADGVWKFWHFTITNDFFCDYHHSWVDLDCATDDNVVHDNMPVPDRPNTFVPVPYSKSSITVLYPEPPDPYETY